MKIYSLILTSIIFILSYSSGINAQNKIGVGINLGGGSMSGNFVSQGAFTSSIFVETNPGFGNNFLARLSFIYISDENILLAQSPGRYNSFLKGFSLKGIATQEMSGSIYIEESLGPLLLNDRTFENLNIWDFGASFSLVGGLDLRDENKTGIKIGLGADYGLTFTNTNVRYISLHLHAEYMF